MIEGIVLVILFVPIALITGIFCLNLIVDVILELKDIFND